MKNKILKRMCILFGMLMVIIVFSFMLLDGYVSKEGSKYMIELEDQVAVDAIIVLGARVKKSGTPSIMLQDRLDMGLAAYEEGVAHRILVSGDHGTKEYDEVNSMRDYIKDKDISDECIFMDHAGFSTYESMYRAKEIFLIERAVIVTQEYHIKRAIYIARTMGIEAYGIPSDQHTYPKMAYYELREKAARVKDFFKSKLKIQPTYLGKVIPIWESGVETHD